MYSQQSSREERPPSQRSYDSGSNRDSSRYGSQEMPPRGSSYPPNFQPNGPPQRSYDARDSSRTPYEPQPRPSQAYGSQRNYAADSRSEAPRPQNYNPSEYRSQQPRGPPVSTSYYRESHSQRSYDSDQQQPSSRSYGNQQLPSQGRPPMDSYDSRRYGSDQARPYDRNERMRPSSGPEYGRTSNANFEPIASNRADRYPPSNSYDRAPQRDHPPFNTASRGRSSYQGNNGSYSRDVPQNSYDRPFQSYSSRGYNAPSSSGRGYDNYGSQRYDNRYDECRTPASNDNQRNSNGINPENRAPRDYVPKSRNIDDIFKEDCEDAAKYESTIVNEDAEVVINNDKGNYRRCELWEDMELDRKVYENIKKSNYNRPRKIQQVVIPLLQDQMSIKCQSETGSGKTAAFLIPIIDNLMRMKAQTNKSFPDDPLCLVIAPTRELVKQLYEQAKKFTDGTHISVAFAYGEYSMVQNRRQIREGCNILIGCLGRLLHFIQEGTFSLASLKYLIIDEVDKLLGEKNDRNGLIDFLSSPELPCKESLVTALFSATLHSTDLSTVAQYINIEKAIEITSKAESNKRIQYVMRAVPTAPAKFRYLTEYMKEIFADRNGKKPRILVFVNTKINVDRIAMQLTSNGFPSTTIHGDRGQHLREEALAQFRSGEALVLVATDVCARGVDIKDLDYIINYDLPNEKSTFVQRCGRTGRSHKGVAMSLYLQENDSQFAQTVFDIIESAGQQAPNFLRSSVKPSDFLYERSTDENTADSSLRQPPASAIAQDVVIPDVAVDESWF